MPLPAPKPPKSKSKNQSFASWAKSKGIDAAVAADIQKMAGAYGINPYYFAAVLLAESGAKHYGKDGKFKSSGQAGGIGQIAYSWIGTQQPWGDHHRITLADIRDYNFNLRFAAYLLGQAVNTYGYSGAYLKGYNPNDPNKQKAWARIKSLLPRGEIPGVVSGVGGPAKDAATINTDTNAYQAAQQFLDPIYLAYSGRVAPAAAVKRYLTHPVSTYQLTNRLAQMPRFWKSPIWQSTAPQYQAIWHEIYGPGSTPDKEAIRYAIIHNLQGSFAERLRQRPDYNQSQEYKGLQAQYTSQYSAIYGTPDSMAMNKIDMAVRKGWNSDQWKQFLRHQPEWQSSGEYKSLAIGLVNSLGFEPGLGSQQTVLGGQS